MTIGKKTNKDIFDTTQESMIQSGYRVVAADATGTPSTDKVFVSIRFPLGGSLTALTDASLLSGDATTIVYAAGDSHYGRATSYTADAITIAVEGV